MTSNSEFFIHNPWGDPFSMSGFTADDYEKRAEEIRQVETKLLDFYVKKTGADRDTIANYMKEETSLTADQALELKFITKVVDTINARASLGAKPKQQFKDMKDTKKALSALDRVVAFLKGESSSVVALDMTLEDGTAIVVETEANEPAVGDAVTINGEPAPDGEHKLADGTVLMIAGGKITEIKKADASAQNADANAQIEALTKENEKLKTDLEAAKEGTKALTKENADFKTDLEKLTKQITDIQDNLKKVGSNFVPPARSTENRDTKPAENQKVNVQSVIEARKKKQEEARAEAQKK